MNTALSVSDCRQVNYQNLSLMEQGLLPAFHKQPKQSGTTSVFGRMVDSITHSTTYQKASDNLYKTFKPIKDYLVDFASWGGVILSSVREHASHGALAGVAVGAGLTLLCPPTAALSFSVAISSGITAGAIMGGLKGIDEASSHWQNLRLQRHMEDSARHAPVIPNTPILI